MFRIRPRDLTPTGWLLAVLAMALGVLASVPVALWARVAVGRDLFRILPEVVAGLLGLPGILLAMLTFHYGGRILQRAGIRVLRPQADESQPMLAREPAPQTRAEPVDLTFGDNVRVRTTAETEAAGVAGRFGQVYGMTTPSLFHVEILGTPEQDHAINVHLADLDEARWFAPHLLEFVDHGAGTEIRLGGIDKRWVRAANGEWIEESLATPKRPWWRFW